MDDEITVKFRSRKGLLLVYRPCARSFTFPDLTPLANLCEVQELSRLSEASILAADRRQVVVLVPNIMGRRASVLQILREKVPHVQVLLLQSWDDPAGQPGEPLVFDGTVPQAEEAVSARYLAIAAALRNSGRLHGLLTENVRLVRENVNDSVTGLYNQGHILDLLEREFKRAERSHESFSCILLDIDHFAHINETYGHRFGNYVLHEISYILRLALRHSDTAGRFGGEEFLVLLPTTDSTGASKVAEKLRKTIETHLFRMDDSAVPVTASIGFASNMDPGVTSPETQLQALGRAVFVAKEAGRNRICGVMPEPSDQNASSPHSVSATTQAPLILALTRSPELREVLNQVAELEGYQLLSFEDHGNFVDEFQGFHPSAVIVDCTFSQFGPNFLGQLIITAKQASLPLLLVVNAEFLRREPQTCEYADDLLSDSLSSAEIGRKLNILMKMNGMERQLRLKSAQVTTLQKRMIANERFRAMGEMMAAFAAQFRVVLENVIGPVQMLLEREMVSGDAEAVINGIKRSSEAGDVTVRQLHHYLRPRAPGEARLVSLSEIIRAALDITSPVWHHSALTDGRAYHVNSYVEPHLHVLADANDLKEIFVNIITDAISTMPKGGALTFSSQVMQNQVQISISQTGRVFTSAEEELKSLFSAPEGQHPRSIGMQVAWSLVRRYKGHMVFETDDQKCVIMRVALPLTGIEFSEEKPMIEDSTLPENLRILFADDEKIVRDVYALLLEKMGHSVETVAQTDALEEALAGEPADLAIIDASFPGVSGWELAGRLHEKWPQCALVLMSGWGVDYPQAMLDSHNVLTVVQKPIQHSDLESVLQKYREQRSEQHLQMSHTAESPR